MSGAFPRQCLTVLVAILFVANLLSNFPLCVESDVKQSTSDLATSSLSSHRNDSSPVQDGSANEVAYYDPALEALEEHNYPKSRISNVLPEKLYVIYGLESSGTTFMAETIARAVGITRKLSPDTVESTDRTIHIQHLSLPLGGIPNDAWGHDTRWTKPLTIAPVYYPTGCRPIPNKFTAPSVRPVKNMCKEVMGETVMTTPFRYFVNVTTHVEWYRERGVMVYPIMVIRDPAFHFEGILSQRPGHCRDPKAAFQQYEQGRAIMTNSIPNVKPIVVSYETLLTLQKEYLQDIYNRLNLKSSYFPSFRNGNIKYLQDSDGPQFIHTQLRGGKPASVLGKSRPMPMGRNYANRPVPMGRSYAKKPIVWDAQSRIVGMHPV